MKEVKKCLYCGKEFKIWPSRKKKYCSIKCYQKTLKGSGNPNYNNKWTDKKKKEASMIKKEYFKNNKVWNKGLTIETDERVKKYAETQKGQKRKIKWTKEAIIKFRRNKIKMNLENNPMNNPKTRKKLSETLRRRYRNKEIKPWNKGIHAWYIAGKNHPRWKGDDFNRTDYRGGDWKIQRKKRLEYDNYKCQICGKINNLVVHHIKRWQETQDNSLNNLITLCSSCHIKTHWRNKKNGR